MPAIHHQHDPDEPVTLPPSYTFSGVVDSTGIVITLAGLNGTLIRVLRGDDEAADAIEHVAKAVTR